MTGAELAGRLEKLAESWTAASAACLRISDADAGHTNGLVAQGEANALRDCAQDLLAALAALPPPAAGGPEVSLVEMVDWSQGYERSAPPLWRVTLGEQVADFEHEQAARNWASAIVGYAGRTADRLRTGLPPAAGDARAEVELAAREKMREFINAMADEYAHEHFIYDPTTGVWEAGNETKESYELGLRDAAGAIARLNCEKFGHDWRRWNDITRRCYRCEIQEHGEHLRTALAQAET